MKYHFEHEFTLARMLVITLDKGDLQSMWADNEEGKEDYQDLTVAFDIDRYLRLRAMVVEIGKQDPHFGRLHMAAFIDSRSAVAAEQKIRGAYIEIENRGMNNFDALWWDNYSLNDYGIELNMPPEFKQNPTVWFETEIGKQGFRLPEKEEV